MGLREQLKRFLPPVLADRARAWSGEWQFVASDWPTSHATRGWKAESVAAAHAAGWDAFQRSVVAPHPFGMTDPSLCATAADYLRHNAYLAYGCALAMAAAGKGRLSILDWGGAVGQYRVVSEALLPWLELDYHVRDVPAACAEGRRLMPTTSFHDTDGAALHRSYDFVLASGALQYWPEWRRVARDLVRVATSHLFVTRLPVVHRTGGHVVRQRAQRYGYQTEYLGWILNRGQFLAEVEAAGGDLVREFILEGRPLVPRAPEQAEYRGFLFRRAPHRDTDPSS